MLYFISLGVFFRETIWKSSPGPDNHWALPLLQVQQAAEGAAGSSSSGGTQVSPEVSSRIANMLRGGILYVKIKKGMDAIASGDEDGIPQRATQARDTLHHFFPLG